MWTEETPALIPTALGALLFHRHLMVPLITGDRQNDSLSWNVGIVDAGKGQCGGTSGKYLWCVPPTYPVPHPSPFGGIAILLFHRVEVCYMEDNFQADLSLSLDNSDRVAERYRGRFNTVHSSPGSTNS